MDAEDFEFQELGAAESGGLTFHGFDLVVDAFQEAGRQRVIVPGKNIEVAEAKRFGEPLTKVFFQPL